MVQIVSRFAAAAGKVLLQMLRRELVQPRLRERVLLRLLSLLLNLRGAHDAGADRVPLCTRISTA